MENDGAIPTDSPELAECPIPRPLDSALERVSEVERVSACESVELRLAVSAVEWVTDPDSPQDSLSERETDWLAVLEWLLPSACETPSAVPLVKDAVRSLTQARCVELAQRALVCKTGTEVLGHCRKLMSEVAPELLELI